MFFSPSNLIIISNFFSAFESGKEDLIEAAAILLGSAAQSNSKVQTSAGKAGLIKTVLDLYEKW
jgi:hypothetical protein